MPIGIEPLPAEAAPVDLVAVGDASSLTQGSVSGTEEGIGPGGLITGGAYFSQAEVPGDLGELFSDSIQNSLISSALRKSAAENFFTPRNHRYRGAREAWKFNLAIQQLMALVASTFTTLKARYATLKGSETTIMPTDTELATIYHCREQLRFQEWIVQKDEDKEWFE
jgi:hypothetical protein